MPASADSNPSPEPNPAAPDWHVSRDTSPAAIEGRYGEAATGNDGETPPRGIRRPEMTYSRLLALPNETRSACAPSRPRRSSRSAPIGGSDLPNPSTWPNDANARSDPRRALAVTNSESLALPPACARHRIIATLSRPRRVRRPRRSYWAGRRSRGASCLVLHAELRVCRGRAREATPVQRRRRDRPWPRWDIRSLPDPRGAFSFAPSGSATRRVGR